MKHNIIKTENYLLVVDDSKIKQNDFFYGVADGSIKPFIEIADETTVEIVTWQLNVVGKSPNKKIAAHLPLNNSSVLEGVPLLPPLENDVERLAMESWISDKYNEELFENGKGAYCAGFWEGFKAATKVYSEEDLRKAIDMARETLEYDENRGWYNTKSEDKIIQSLQQPKMPVAFECEIFEAKDLKSVDGDWLKLGQPKTTTNPQGQTVLAGKYIY
jgi:hypothetical protein